MEKFIYFDVFLYYMEINYKELYTRLTKEERDIDLAHSVGISVSVLYKNWQKLGLLHSRKITDALWEEYYNLYTKKEKTTLEIANLLEVTINTVYNNFKRFGYQRQQRTICNRDEVYREYQNGASVQALSIKHKITPQHVRMLIRKFS